MTTQLPTAPDHSGGRNNSQLAEDHQILHSHESCLACRPTRPREPLSALCAAATDSGFLIEKLIEPVPAETMRERYPEDYEKLSKEPGFLILRLLKPATPNPTAPS